MKTSCHGKETVIPNPELPVRDTVNFPSTSPRSERVTPKRTITTTTTPIQTSTTTATPTIQSTTTTTIRRQNNYYDDFDTTLSVWYNDYLRLTTQPAAAATTTTATKSTAQMAAEIREFLTTPPTIDKFPASELIPTTTTTVAATTTSRIPITLPNPGPIHFPDAEDSLLSFVRPKPKRNSSRRKNNVVVAEKPVDSYTDDYNFFVFSNTYYYPNV